MITAALALLLLWQAQASPICAQLQRHGRLLEGSAADQDRWEIIRAAYLEHFDSQSGNAAARRAARQLRTSAVRLTSHPISDLVAQPAAAVYEPQADLIAIDDEEFLDLWRAWPKRRQRRKELKKVVERTAPFLIHELTHARLRQELGLIPPFIEEEIIADAEEAFFLLEQSRLDRRSLERSSERWLDERRLLVGGLKAGYDSFISMLDDAGVLDGPSALDLDPSRRKRRKEEARALRLRHQDCMAAADPSTREGLAAWVARLRAEEGVYDSEARLAELAARFRQLMEQQRRELVDKMR